MVSQLKCVYLKVVDQFSQHKDRTLPKNGDVEMYLYLCNSDLLSMTITIFHYIPSRPIVTTGHRKSVGSSFYLALQQ